MIEIRRSFERQAGCFAGGMQIKSHRDLEAWRCSMRLVESNRSTRLRATFRRTNDSASRASSDGQLSLFPSNIVEGNGFGRTGRYVHHLPIARGSKAELETQLELAKQRGFIEPPRIEPLLIESGEIGRMLNELISSLERRTD